MLRLSITEQTTKGTSYTRINGMSEPRGQDGGGKVGTRPQVLVASCRVEREVGSNRRLCRGRASLIGCFPPLTGPTAYKEATEPPSRKPVISTPALASPGQICRRPIFQAEQIEVLCGLFLVETRLLLFSTGLVHALWLWELDCPYVVFGRQRQQQRLAPYRTCSGRSIAPGNSPMVTMLQAHRMPTCQKSLLLQVERLAARVRIARLICPSIKDERAVSLTWCTGARLQSTENSYRAVPVSRRRSCGGFNRLLAQTCRKVNRLHQDCRLQEQRPRKKPPLFGQPPKQHHCSTSNGLRKVDASCGLLCHCCAPFPPAARGGPWMPGLMPHRTRPVDEQIRTASGAPAVESGPADAQLFPLWTPI
jgi:hypothetical protein